MGINMRKISTHGYYKVCEKILLDYGKDFACGKMSRIF